MGSHEVAGKGYVNTKNSKMASIGAIFSSIYHTKQLHKSSASRVVNYNQLSACQGEMEPFKTTLAFVDIWQASEASHNKSSLGNFQHQYLGELLVNVYSYHLMVKSVSYYCVHGKQLFSNLVT